MLPCGVVHRSGYHYGLTRRSPHPGSMRVDMQTVDPDIRPLVAMLHQRGAPTLPSCQGHFRHSPRMGYYKNAIADLTDQAPLIREGLVMRDVETAQRRLVRSPSWRAPTLGELWAADQALIGAGYLAFVPPPNSRMSRMRPVRFDWAFIQPVAGRIDVWVSAPSEWQQRRTWEAVTRHMERL
jgi:hypothetical protein